MKYSRLLFGMIVAVALTASGANAAQQLSWDDLTIPVDPASDPYIGLPGESQADLEQITFVESLRETGEAIDELQEGLAQTSRLSLANAGFDVASLLERERRYIDLVRKSETTLREDLNGQDIRIPGYVLPLEFEGDSIKEFLLVPYVGACIHTPPPAANQIIHVTANASYKTSGLFTPVWVSGRLNAKTTRQSVGLSDGSSDFDVGYQLQATGIETYAE